MFSCFLKCYPRSQEGAFSPFGTANLGTKKTFQFVWNVLERYGTIWKITQINKRLYP